MGKRAIVQDTLSYVGSTVLIQNISFLLAIYIRRVLGPEAMGVWVLLQVFLNYVGYGNLGMLNAVCREIPILRGRSNQEKRIESIKNSGFTYILFVGLVTSALMAIGTCIWRGKLSDYLFYGFLATAVVNILQRINNYLIQLFHVEKKFVFISKFKVCSALANALLVIAFAWKYKLYGFYVATILSYVFNVLYLHFLGGMRFKLAFNKAEIGALIKFGAPLLALAGVVTLLGSIDKISISKLLGLKQLGVYSIAILAGNYIFILPTVFQTVLYPRTLEKFGNETDIKGRVNYSTVPGKLMSIYFSFCIGLIWIAAPYFCKIFLPKYVEGVPSLKVLMFGYCFLALSQQLSHVLLGYGRHLLMLPVSFVLVLAAFGTNYVMVQNGGGIVQIATVMTFTMLINYVACACLALKPLYQARQMAGQLLYTLAPLVVGFSVLSCLDRLWPYDVFGVVLAKSLFYLCLWGIFVLAMEGQLGIIQLFKEVYSGWSAKRKNNLAMANANQIQDLSSSGD